MVTTGDILPVTVVGRVLVKNSPQIAVGIPKDAAPGLYEVSLWVADWFNRERQTEPVFFAYRKDVCSPASAPVLPMDSTEKKLRAKPGTFIWVCAESDVWLNYSVDKIPQALCR